MYYLVHREVDSGEAEKAEERYKGQNDLIRRATESNAEEAVEKFKGAAEGLSEPDE